MKIRVNPHNVEIVREETEPINELEVKVSKCEFEFDEKITNEFVKEAYFTLNGSTYKQIIVNNECDYPNEVLTETGTLEIGVVAYKVENEEEIIRYNPSPDYYDTWVGSLKDAENSQPITPSEMEQFEQELQDGLNDIEDAIERAEKLDVDVSKEGNKTTITITKQDGSTESEEILDGAKGDKGDKGDQGIPGPAGTTDYNQLINKPNLDIYALISESANKISLEMNSQTFQMKAKIFDKNNNLLSESNVIDFPIESVVVSGRYDSVNQKIILTLENGNTIDIPVSSLVSGLVNQSDFDAAMNNKVDKVTGKGLSTNDFTNSYKTQSDTDHQSIATINDKIPDDASSSNKLATINDVQGYLVEIPNSMINTIYEGGQSNE